MGNLNDRVRDKDWDVNVCSVWCLLFVSFENLIWGHLASLLERVCDS